MTDLTDERLRDVAEFHRDPVTRNIDRELLAHRTNGGEAVAWRWHVNYLDRWCWSDTEPAFAASDLERGIVFDVAPLYASPVSIPQDGTSGVRVTDPEQYRKVHDAAIAAYEAATPPDYRYSATALRRAVDAAFAALEPSP